MSLPPRLSPYLWIIAPLVALGFLLWLTAARLHRVDHITNLVATEATVDPASPTGYAGGWRKLIAPGHNNDSYQWIVQTQQMLARGEWRLRHVGYDNAPIGRTVLTASPYRWWLGLVAEVDHALSGRPVGLSVERAARIADPALHALLVLGAVIFVAWRFGGLPAGVLSVALVTMFPFSGVFLPGQPGDDGLVLFCALWSMLLLLAGTDVGGASIPARTASRWFVWSGVVGGLGLWVDVVRMIPVVAGIGLGGLLALWFTRRTMKIDPSAPPAVLPWRLWALGVAITSLAAYLLEYSPGNLGSLYLREVHPLYGLAWLGLGELLARVTGCAQQGASFKNRRTLAATTAAMLAMAAVPVSLIMTEQRDLFTADPAAVRLTGLADSPVAQNLWTWIRQDGLARTAMATDLPLLLLAPVVWLVARRATDWSSRASLALALGPVLVALGFACFQLRGWNLFDATLLALLVALVATTGRALDSAPSRWACIVGVLLVLTPGAMLLVEKALADRREAVTESDVVGLIERDLAHWLARQAGPEGAVVLAPPGLTVSLIYHGGLAGLGTPYWENQSGFAVAARIASVTAVDEALAVARKRNLRYIVVPSWDNFLDEYAGLGTEQADRTLIDLLHRWLPPRWLRPVPYQLPRINGLEGHSVQVFEVGEVLELVTVLSHLAEYFVEMHQFAPAVAASQALARSFPSDMDALVARALVSHAVDDRTGFKIALDEIQTALSRGDDQTLPWDRRVSLAIALVESRHFDQAREQVKRCLAELDETRLRSLTTVSLHRLLVMSRGFGLEFGDARLRGIAQQLLPPELREHP